METEIRNHAVDFSGSWLTHKFVVTLLLLFGLSCATVPVMADEPRAPSAESIKAEKEKEFAQRVERIKQKDAKQDADDAKALGFPYLLGYFAGRSTETIIPGVEKDVYERVKERCPVLILDGFGDTLYGQHHAAYRKVMTAYAEEFNAITFEACKQ